MAARCWLALPVASPSWVRHERQLVSANEYQRADEAPDKHAQRAGQHGPIRELPSPERR